MKRRKFLKMVSSIFVSIPFVSWNTNNQIAEIDKAVPDTTNLTMHTYEQTIFDSQGNVTDVFTFDKSPYNCKCKCVLEWNEVE
jgi:hypothetical protein